MRVIVWWKRLLYLTIYWYRMAVLCRIYTWYRYAAIGPVPCDQRSQQYTINSYKQKPMCKTEMWLLWLVTAWLLWLVNHMVPGPAMYNGGQWVTDHSAVQPLWHAEGNCMTSTQDSSASTWPCYNKLSVRAGKRWQSSFGTRFWRWWAKFLVYW